MQWANPRAFILNIEEATDRSWLQNRSGTKYKTCTIVHHINYCNFFDFQWNNIPLEWLSTASSSGHFDYSYACIHHLIIEDFDVEIHHGRLHFFVNSFFFKFWFYHSYLLFTSYLKNLKKTFFFSCATFMALYYFQFSYKSGWLLHVLFFCLN